jgi:sulfide dehydrogenase [flavocytochrome c] flavoprotein chain
MSLSRRTLLQASLGAALTAAPYITYAQGSQHIVIIGGGMAGATAAKYLKRFNPQLKVTLIEPNSALVMGALSNRVIHGSLTMSSISQNYDALVSKHQIKLINAYATEIDPEKRVVRMGKESIVYDRLIVAPGLDFNYEGIPGLTTPQAQALVPHAWTAGPQTAQLRSMLKEMRQGGVMAIHIPKAPYRCPPGPYERACLVADYLKNFNPKGKVIVYDSNPSIQAKKELFEAAWKSEFAGIVEYVPNAEIERVDAATGMLELQLHGKQKVDVLNVIPPQRAGSIAQRTGLANVANRWCGVDFLTYESTQIKNIHVLGDSIASAPGMPKSGHMANQEAKVCAAAIAALSLGQPVQVNPIMTNTCYSFFSASKSAHVAAVFRYDATKKVMAPTAGAGGLSAAPTVAEGVYAMSWATNIMYDTLG